MVKKPQTRVPRGNSYAKAAGALILVCTDEGEDERTARYAAVDAGVAIAQLIVEAVSRRLIAHPIAGFNADGACEVFGIPAGVRPIARGRERLPLEEVAFAGRWREPAQL